MVRRGQPGQRALYTAGAIERATCAVRLTGPTDPEIGQRYIRDISIGGDTPVISFHVVMQNMSGFPQTWSGREQVHRVPYLESLGLREFQHPLPGSDSGEPRQRVPQQLPRAHRNSGKPGFLSQQQRVRVQWNNIVQEV